MGQEGKLGINEEKLTTESGIEWDDDQIPRFNEQYWRRNWWEMWREANKSLWRRIQKKFITFWILTLTEKQRNSLPININPNPQWQT